MTVKQILPGRALERCKITASEIEAHLPTVGREEIHSEPGQACPLGYSLEMVSELGLFTTSKAFDCYGLNRFGTRKQTKKRGSRRSSDTERETLVLGVIC